MPTERYWSVLCMEHVWPGLWQAWESRQVATVGWPPHPGGDLLGFRRTPRWSEVVNCLERMSPGDGLVARLPGNRIGRVGQVLEKRITQGEWSPLVPRSLRWEYGEQGRQILVRWDFEIGPSLGSGLGCRIPPNSGKQLGSWDLRRAVVEITRGQYRAFGELLRDESTWTGVSGDRFAQERALSDYIARYPEALRQGLRAYPMVKGREKSARKRKMGKGRLDVLLLDRDGKTPVVVECKQVAPEVAHIRQLLGYMKSVTRELGRKPKGILVFAGSPNVAPEVRKAARKAAIELYAYRLNVEFMPSRVR